MSSSQMIFKRYEIKYLVSDFQYRSLRKFLEGCMEVDAYGKSSICNIYFDTPDARIIRTSLEKPVYKEKLRLRSYGTAERDTEVFVELKKKYQGVVYKRREEMVLSEAEAYLYRGKEPGVESQVLREVDWFLKFYNQVVPAMYISYDRVALYGVEEPELRVTFDWNIKWRREDLSLRKGAWGKEILKENERLMEIKITGSMPIWLSTELDKLQIYPISFSKYGLAYQDSICQSEAKKGGEVCA